MKKMLLPFSLVLSVFSSQAQHSAALPASFGLKAGGSYSNFRLKDYTAGSAGNWKPGAVAGAFLTVPLTSRLSIQPELLYLQAGGDIRFTDPAPMVAKQELAYLSVPLQAKLQLSKKFAILAGPQFDFLLNARSTIGGDAASNKAEMRKTDIGVSAGIEFAPVRSLLLTARYVYGLQNVPRDEAPGGVYNNSLQVTIGYRLFCKQNQATNKRSAVKLIDSDNDGLNDALDKCPTLAGSIAYGGCPAPDRDHDGFNDENDRCPDVAGDANGDGCPPTDRDHDGINDRDDKCPDLAGSAKYQGCPVRDRDRDGISDEDDRCPDVAGTASSSGCPDLKTNRFDASTVQFLSGSTTLTEDAMKSLSEGASILNNGSFRALKILIAGYTDNTGKPVTNRNLSQQRADAVKAYLVSIGIAADRIKAIGYGAEKPIADNSTLEGRSRNRRVEFTVTQ